MFKTYLNTKIVVYTSTHSPLLTLLVIYNFVMFVVVIAPSNFVAYQTLLNIIILKKKTQTKKILGKSCFLTSVNSFNAWSMTCMLFSLALSSDICSPPPVEAYSL